MVRSWHGSVGVWAQRQIRSGREWVYLRTHWLWGGCGSSKRSCPSGCWRCACRAQESELCWKWRSDDELAAWMVTEGTPVNGITLEECVEREGRMWNPNEKQHSNVRWKTRKHEEAKGCGDRAAQGRHFRKEEVVSMSDAAETEWETRAVDWSVEQRVMAID